MSKSILKAGTRLKASKISGLTQNKKKSAAIKAVKSSSKVVKSKKNNEQESCVIYLGHISHGFYEKQMIKFFEQFGRVKQVKLFRSKKSKASRGYAFIEFHESDVAATVADTMNGYYLHERQLVSHVIPIEKHHTGMFAPPKGTKKKGEKEDVVEELENDDDDENEIDKDKKIDHEKAAKTFIRNQKKKQKKLKELGIEFDLEIPS